MQLKIVANLTSVLQDILPLPPGTFKPPRFKYMKTSPMLSQIGKLYTIITYEMMPKSARQQIRRKLVQLVFGKSEIRANSKVINVCKLGK